MAIGPIHLAWMKRVWDRGGPRGEVIDLGPQDIQIARSILTEVAYKLLRPVKANPLLDAIYDGDTARRTCQKDFYALFGLSDYQSLDAEDDRATYKHDLNFPIPKLPEFDVVTNFGTTEHVFNIGQAFSTIHELTRP